MLHSSNHYALLMHESDVRLNAVLFVWRGTLFHDVSDLDWMRASAASIGRALSDDEAIELSRALASVGDHSDVIGAPKRGLLPGAAQSRGHA